MLLKLKIAAYVILVALAIWFGHSFGSNYSNLIPVVDPTDVDGTDNAPTNTAVVTDGTNQIAATTNAPDTNSVAATDVSTNPPPVAADTNANPDLAGTNDLTGTNLVKRADTGTNALAAKKAKKKHKVATAVTPQTTQGRSVGSLVGLVGAMVGLGVLIAYDVSQYFSSQAVDFLFSDAGPGSRDPEYEKAEEMWVNGKPLDAIQMMRDYLKKHPREQYVALRIAEIYEKDLRNYVAASLEYEEVLKKKLPAEKWGWAAIHLCNIYTKLGQQEKARALLERIANEYPRTAAAKKARRNLGLPEPEQAEAAPEPVEEEVANQNPEGQDVFNLDEVIASTEEEPGEAPPPAKNAPPPPESSKPNLPPGFRKK